MLVASDAETENGGQESEKPRPKKRRARRPVTDRVDVGGALRSAFQATVEEDVPSEMLDLLRRLS